MSESTTDTPRCKGTNKEGKPCSATPYRGEWCYWHDPARAEERRAVAARGGRNSSIAARTRKQLKRYEFTDIDTTLCTLLDEVIAGTVEPNVANAAATVARTIHSIRTAVEIEDRISKIEAALRREGRIA